MTAHHASRARLRLVDPDLEPATVVKQPAPAAFVASATAREAVLAAALDEEVPAP